MRTPAPVVLPIFRSDQQLRILGALFERRGAELSISDLASATKVAIATASREVERLEAHGIVRSRHVGRSRLVSANWDLPWADALSLILAHTVGPPASIAAALRGVPGICSAFIYGSWAARRAGEVGPPPADLDLLVIGMAPREEIRNALREVEKGLKLEINPVVVAEKEWATADSGFLNELRSRPMFEVDLVDLSVA